MIRSLDRFTASYKSLDAYTYVFIGIEPENAGREIVLFNETLSEETRVEEEWFRHRNITMVDRA